jgi:Tissue inhibitor of metalloproteinase
MTWIFRMFTVAAFASMAFTTARGCTCAFGSGPACQEAWRQGIDAVFLGRVDKIESTNGSVGFSPGAMSMTTMGSLLRVTISIDEVFRGSSAKAIQVYTASSSAACGYSFHEGQKYLIYASAEDKSGQLLVSLCSATKPAEYAEKDVAYLRSLPSLASTSAIIGTVWRYTHDPNFKPKFQPSIMDHYRPPEQEYMAMKPELGFTILVKAPDGTEHSASADDDGNWRIPDLPPGRYTLQPQIRDGVYVYPLCSTVEIAPKGCAQVNVRIEANGRISGTLDHPTPGSDWVLVKVFALLISESNWRRPTRETTLEPNASTFEVGPLPAGRYVLGAYVVTKISTGNGYTFGNLGPFYYPSVTGIKGAEPIDVVEGKAVTNLKFKMMY